ncbi:hypothetical protein GDO81_022051 [Engystomops pustulosus]|uniref:Uncharacterized protein n=1 Tax=Engystomops pustulosus TaxID=76066 RepID=A0AAV6YNR5_ENGPU|nr:hypothetical protein GDO81_022051 [Engystomops pustulosus]
MWWAGFTQSHDCPAVYTDCWLEEGSAHFPPSLMSGAAYLLGSVYGGSSPAPAPLHPLQFDCNVYHSDVILTICM